MLLQAGISPANFSEPISLCLKTVQGCSIFSNISSIFTNLCEITVNLDWRKKKSLREELGMLLWPY